jgi:mycofactocin precursor
LIGAGGAVTMALSATRQEIFMGDHVTVPAPADDHAEAEPLAADELLVEEVSIDGMCGVY